jgi:hypothetical protein
MEVGNTDFNRAGGRHQGYRRQLLNLKRALSLDMTLDSIRVLRGHIRAGVPVEPGLVRSTRWALCAGPDHSVGWNRGCYPAARAGLVRGPGPTPDAMREFDHSVGELCQAGTQLRLYINPTHAMTSDALFWAGRWPALEHWQLELVTLVARYQSSVAMCSCMTFPVSTVLPRSRRRSSAVKRRCRITGNRRITA